MGSITPSHPTPEKPSILFITANLPTPEDEAAIWIGKIEAYLHDPLAALRARGATVTLRTFQDPSLTAAAIASSYTHILLLAVDRYIHHMPAFTVLLTTTLPAAQRLNPRLRIHNPPAIAAWNANKTYLAELQAVATGFAVPRTAFLDPATTDAAALAAHLAADPRVAAAPSTPIVLKPSIAASGHSTYLIRTPLALTPADGAALDAMRGAAAATGRHDAMLLVQEYLPRVAEADGADGDGGEWSFVVVKGRLTHAVRKRPREGEFRINSAFAGVWEPMEAGDARLTKITKLKRERSEKEEMEDKDVSALNKEQIENAEAAKERKKQYSSRKVTLVTSDGVEIEIERRVAEKSNLIKDLIADFGGHVYDPIPIPNVNEQVMRKIIEWCEQEKNNDSAAAEFLDVDHDTLFEIILVNPLALCDYLIPIANVSPPQAANYLDIAPLLDASCTAVANKITGKTPAGICQLFNIASYPLPQLSPTSSPTAPATPPSAPLPPSRPYNPTLTDIHHARLILQHIPLHSGATLPPELALSIVSLGYRPRLAKTKAQRATYRANSFWRPGPRASVAGLYLSTAPIPHPDAGLGIVKVVPRRVVFRTWAADQGWADFGGDGTFGNSHAWFEASVLRPVGRGDADAAVENVAPGLWEEPGRAREALVGWGWDFVEGEGGRVVWKVCNNITAKAEYSEYTVEWERGVAADAQDNEAVGVGRGFLELLEPGFIVVLWARAEQQCWENSVEKATIEIECEVL
ncbi:hypothetical protein SLS58_010457 [Diplodia intermedia]|uniref:SKP1 component POZ domain-containing protein n=1 Tax=Diplodia intermedia TaxID=856260 RepID=A0ABR3T6K7_9PEZI